MPAAGCLGLALLTVTATLSAQQPDPNVRAARLSFVEGDVQLSQGNQIIANPALANTPAVRGNPITAKEDGKAELQFDDGSVVRISPNSSLKIAALRQDGGASKAELLLESGLAYFELQGDTSASRMVVRFGESTATASGFTVFASVSTTFPVNSLFFRQRSPSARKYPFPRPAWRREPRPQCNRPESLQSR